MNQNLTERVISISQHILNTHDTIRKTAVIYGLSKSTIHNDVSVKLKKIDYDLYLKIKHILDENFAEKHLRGGDATRIKYTGKNKT